MARLASKISIWPFPVVACCRSRLGRVTSSLEWSKLQICCWNFNIVSHSFRVFRVIIIGIAYRTFLGARCGRKTQVCRWNFVISHTFGDISTSGLVGLIAISGCRSMLHLFEYCLVFVFIMIDILFLRLCCCVVHVARGHTGTWQRSLKISLHLKSVTTLLCEILICDNWCVLYAGHCLAQTWTRQRRGVYGRQQLLWRMQVIVIGSFGLASRIDKYHTVIAQYSTRCGSDWLNVVLARRRRLTKITVKRWRTHYPSLRRFDTVPACYEQRDVRIGQTDRRTDGRTDGQPDRSEYRALHSKLCWRPVKMCKYLAKSSVSWFLPRDAHSAKHCIAIVSRPYVCPSVCLWRWCTMGVCVETNYTSN